MSRAGGLLAWRQVMALGLGRLRLSPAHFWALTPRELECALAGAFGDAAAAARPLGRSDLEALMRRFPDAPRSAGQEES